MRDAWKYTGPIFDAHTHIGSIENTNMMIDIEDEVRSRVEKIRASYPELEEMLSVETEG